MATLVQPQAVPETRPMSWPRWARTALLVLVAVGTVWRCLRYLLQFPIWGDEAFVCLNLLDRDYLGLTQPLRFVQVAPLLFLWAERTALRVLGGGELALRLLPFLASLGSLCLFWRLTRLTLPATARLLAVGFLAVAYYPVRHGCEVKPYAFDLFFALALLTAAAGWLRRPERLRDLVLLTLSVPIALMTSYPAVFVAGAVSLALLPKVWRRPDWRAKALYAAYNGLMLASFALVYRIAGTGQYASAGGTDNFYWTEWFPPAQPLALLKWLALAHTGNMMAYPVGGRDGASTLTLLLVLAGAWHLWRARRQALLVLCLTPFALTFIAAALHRYPYGGSARVAQHLAPAICLLAGAGAASGITWLARRGAHAQGLTLTACGLLVLIGGVGMIRDWQKPYKTEGDQEVRRVVKEVFRSAGPADQVIVLDAPDGAAPTFEWYLRQHPERVAWGGTVDWQRLEAGGDLWVFSFSRDGSRRDAFEARLGGRMVRVEQTVADVQLGQCDETVEHYEVYRWTSPER